MWLGGQGLGRKADDKEVWGTGMRMDLSGWAENMRVFVSHMNVYQRVASAEENFNKVDRMACSFPSYDCHCPMTPKKSGHGSRNGGYLQAQQHERPRTKANLVWPPPSAQQANNRCLDVAPFPWQSAS